MKRKKDKGQYTLINNITFLMRDIWKENKFLFVLLIVEGVFCSIVPFLGIYLPKIALELVVREAAVQSIVVVLGGFIVGLTVVMCIGSTARGAKYMHYNGFRMQYMRKIFYKTLSCPYECVESAAGQTNYQKAMNSVSVGDWSGVSRMITSVMAWISSIVSFVLYSAVIVTLNPIILILLVVMSGVNYFALQYARQYEHGCKKELATYEKQLNYVENTASNVKYGKDIRLYTMTGWFMAMREHLLEGYTLLNEQIQNRHFVTAVVNATTLFLRDGIAYIYLIYAAATGRIGVSDFVLFFGAITGFSGWVSQIVNNTNGMISANLQLNDMRGFLDYGDEEECVERRICETGKPMTVAFRHVYFGYDEGENILEDFSMQIEAGEKIALVGLNGTGKTTVVKLLCGFYEPTAGEILIDGIDSKKFSKKERYQLFAAVFQDLLILPFTVAENICMSTKDEVDEARIWECLRQVGLADAIAKHPKGIWAEMTRVFDEEGIILSGGQQQKLLMARAFYKDAPILVLDEPTAALDAIAECEVYEKFDAYSSGKTALYISHRLASTRFCDKIYFVKDGRIAECGTHQALMAQKGGYRALFDIQSHYYNHEVGEVLADAQ
ncbi:MAG: ABC transporter ATP-binding protein [Cellulosilyticaceae bacterium]